MGSNGKKRVARGGTRTEGKQELRRQRLAEARTHGPAAELVAAFEWVRAEAADLDSRAKWDWSSVLALGSPAPHYPADVVAAYRNGRARLISLAAEWLLAQAQRADEAIPATRKERDRRKRRKAGYKAEADPAKAMAEAARWLRNSLAVLERVGTYESVELRRQILESTTARMVQLAEWAAGMPERLMDGRSGFATGAR